MKTELINIREIKTNPNNPRIIKDDKYKKLVKIIQEFPEMLELRPLVIDEGNVVLGGNMRLRALQELKYKQVPCVRANDLTAEQKNEFIVKDNLGYGEWNWEELGNNWDAELLDAWGLDIPDMSNFGNDKTEEELNETPEPQKEAISKLGDLFLLDGKHRVLCGDSTKEQDVSKLMDGKKADMVFTDPPYGIGYKYNSHKDLKDAEYLSFCDKWFDNIKDNDFIVITAGWKYNKYWITKEPKDIMYWLQRNKQTGGTVFHFRRIEPIFVWGNPGKKYNFDFFEQTSDRIDGMRELHTCPKPVGLIKEIISVCDGIIIDIFLGSGTTLIASEQTNRVCYGIELDPVYIDVILKRYHKLYPEKEIVCLNRKFDFNKLFTESVNA